MPRKILTPEEREARRKARNAHTFSDAAYKHYDPDVSGYGSPEDWERIAEFLQAKINDAFRVDLEHILYNGSGPKRATGRFASQLNLLGLIEMPGDLDTLKKAFRAAMFKAHPDYGGTSKAARETMEAFAVLKTQVT